MLKNFYLVFGVLMCFVLSGTAVSAQDSKQSTGVVSQTESKQWQEDLRFMASEAPKWHNNLFHTITPAQFDAAVKRLHERIPNLARHEIIVEMARIVATVGDGHTNIAARAAGGIRRCETTRTAKNSCSCESIWKCQRSSISKQFVIKKALTASNAENQVTGRCPDDLSGGIFCISPTAELRLIRLAFQTAA